MSLAALQAQVDQLTLETTRFQQGTKEISVLTNTERRSLIDVLFPRGVIFHYLDPKLKVGDKVYGDETDPLIPDFQFTAKIASLPSGFPTTPITESNLTEIRKS